MGAKEILNTLRKVRRSLKSFPYDEILKLINSMELTDMIAFKIPKGTVILRGRPCLSHDFNHVNQLSYPRVVKSFGRAQRPGFPMFYGAITSRPEESHLNMMVTIFLEIIGDVTKRIKTEGEEKLAIGRWIVTEDLTVCGMIFHEEYLRKNLGLLDFYNKYLKYISHLEQNRHQIEILKFISSEFAKPVIGTDDDYKISAAFVESVLSKSLVNLDGIVYPSVRAEGDYFNIALTPECVNNKLRLGNVLTTTEYFKDGIVINDYEKEATLAKGEHDFKLKEIKDPKLHFGKEKTLEVLNQEILNGRQIIN